MAEKITKESLELILDQIESVFESESRREEITNILINEGIIDIIYDFKLRVYSQRGNLDHEEFFNTFEEMEQRYRELFKQELYSLNPTKWKLSNAVHNLWERIP